MLGTSILISALVAAAPSFAQVPGSRNQVFFTSRVDTNFVLTPATVDSGSIVIVERLSFQDGEVWEILPGSGTQFIVLQNEKSLCLDAGDARNWASRNPVFVNTCTDTESQKSWSILDDGRIAFVFPSRPPCIYLQSTTAAAGTRAEFSSCEVSGNGLDWPVLITTSGW